MTEPLSYGLERDRGRHAAKAGDDVELVDLTLQPYGEGTVYYVNWKIKPKDAAHAIERVQFVIEPKSLTPVDLNLIAEPGSPGQLLRGESAHRNIHPGTQVRITIFGEVRVGAERKWFSYCRVVISGEDKLTPCAE